MIFPLFTRQKDANFPFLTYLRTAISPAILICLPLLFFITSCNRDANFDFSDQGYEKSLTINYATGLRIWKISDGFRVQVRNPQDTSEVLGTYLLSQNPDASPDSIPYTARVQIPVKNAALNSTTFVPFFSKINESNRIGGITYTDLIVNEDIKTLISAGEIVELTSGGELDYEKVLALNPDIFMAYRYGESNFERYIDKGIPVVMNMEYLETSPLGRAEWIKLVGCLTGKYDESVKIFERIEDEYTDLRELASKADSQPRVFTGMTYGSNWFAQGNKSYVAQYIRDANGIYSFEHIEGHGSKEVDIETVFQVIKDADYWGMVASGELSYQKILNTDKRFTQFASFKKGQIFACNTAEVDYFGDAVMEPEKILADMIAIIHTDLMPTHEFSYFSPVTR